MAPFAGRSAQVAPARLRAALKLLRLRWPAGLDRLEAALRRGLAGCASPCEFDVLAGAYELVGRALRQLPPDPGPLPAAVAALLDVPLLLLTAYALAMRPQRKPRHLMDRLAAVTE
jgi:hypothetical protein